MGNGHGAYVGIEKIVDAGDDARKWNLLIFSEGYLAGDVGPTSTFDTHARAIATAVQGISPISECPTAVNVHRVDVSSTMTGARDPRNCGGGSGAFPSTFFDASYCFQGQRDFLVADYDAALTLANAHCPDWDGLLILVNSSIPGGSAKGQVAVCAAAGLITTGVVDADTINYLGHELGHVFGLADEYVLANDVFSGLEPAAINATVKRTTAGLEPAWGSLVAATTPMPTELNRACKLQNRTVNPIVPSGTIGLFEGACEFGCGVFRPSATCKMRRQQDSFCQVCADAIREVLSHHT